MEEFALRFLFELSPLSLPLAIAAGLTVLAAVILVSLSHGLWMNSPRFKFLCVFYDLSGFLLVKMGAIWIKFILPIIYMAMYTTLSSIHFVFLALIMIFASIDIKKIGRTLLNFVSNALLIAGVFFMNVLYQYMQTGYQTGAFICIYIVAAIFITLYDVFLLLTEVSAVSELRTPYPVREEIRLKREEEREARLAAEEAMEEDEEEEEPAIQELDINIDDTQTEAPDDGPSEQAQTDEQREEDKNE